MLIEIENLSLTRAMEREFREGQLARSAMAAVAQAKINQACATTATKSIDGVGQLIARVDADVYFAMRARFGAECWSDPAFRKRALSSELLTKPLHKSTSTFIDMGAKP